jgi:ABC-type glycerol-3-phosphate transport system permease component
MKMNNHLKDSRADHVFYLLNYCFLCACMMIVATPLLNVIAQSLSSPRAVIAGRVTFWPVEFSTMAYREVFRSKLLIDGYKNSIVYTTVGTCINIVMTVMAAYPLSRPDFVGRNIITKLFVFTMIFTAPLIPTYLNIRNLGMLDKIWAITVPGAISVYNMIIARTFFQNSIPDEMIKAAELDGADDIQIIFMIILPLSKAVLAVLVLFYAVGHWNAYFDAMIYFNSQSKFPLQLALRDILSNAGAIENMTNISIEQSMRLATVEVMKYAIIVFGSLPVICLYPFIQKYFVKGVMIGSLKG